MDISDEERAAFKQNYNQPFDEKAVDIYRMFNRVLAFGDCFMAPVANDHRRQWIADTVDELDDLVNKLS